MRELRTAARKILGGNATKRYHLSAPFGHLSSGDGRGRKRGLRR